MNSFTPAYNSPKRKQKGLIKMFGGISVPFYFVTQVVAEGTPVKFDLAVPEKLTVSAPGDGAATVGLTLQETYDESGFGQLKGYHFANDTRQRLDGNPIGVLMGNGWALTNNFTGVVAYGNQAAIAASGKLKAAAGVAADNLPVFFEGAGSNGDTMVRVRFDFPVATR